MINFSNDTNSWPNPIAVQDSSYDITGLLSSSEYWRVRANLGNGLYSEWSNTKRINKPEFIFDFAEIAIPSENIIMATAPFLLLLETTYLDGGDYSFSGEVELSASD